jgi:hypothetical protein
MAVPHGTRFPIPFDEMFPQGAYLMADIQPLTEYQSQKVKARNRPVQPRADASGRAKWIAWVVRTAGLRAVQAPGRGSAKVNDAGKSAA